MASNDRQDYSGERHVSDNDVVIPIAVKHDLNNSPNFLFGDRSEDPLRKTMPSLEFAWTDYAKESPSMNSVPDMAVHEIIKGAPLRTRRCPSKLSIRVDAS